MMLTIEQAGLSSSWVDLGRKMAQIQGFCQSGPLDWFNYQLANAICANEANTPVLEILAGHFAVRASQDSLVCITGAHVDIESAGELKQLNTLFLLRAGELLQLKGVTKGLYNYVAVAGQANLPLFKHSVCAVKKERKGGLHKNGEGLCVGDKIEVHLTTTLKLTGLGDLESHVDLPNVLVNNLASYFQSTLQMPISLCYQAATFNKLEKFKLLAHEFLVTNSIDRMGVRLQGPSIASSIKVLQSQALVCGAVQITGEGQAIIMRNEAQTIGGYPVIGVVSQLALMLLSHARAHDRVSFVLANANDNAIKLKLILRALHTLTKNQSTRIGK